MFPSHNIQQSEKQNPDDQTLQAQYKPPTNRRITVAFGGQFDPMLTHIARQWSRRERTRIIAITHHPENLTNAYDDIIIPRINAATFDDSLLQKIDIAYFFALSPPQQSPDYEAVAEDLMLATASAFVHAATRSPQLKLVFVTRLFKSAIRPQTRDSWLLHLQRLTAIFESSHHSNISLTILKTAPVLSTRDPLIADMLNNRYSAKVANLLGKFDHLAQPVDLPFFEQMCFNSCEIQPTKSSAHRNYQLLHCAGQKQLTYSHLIKTLAKLPKANTHTQTRTKGKKYQPTHLRSPMSNIAQLAKMTCFHSVALNGYRPLSPTPFKTALAWLKDEITTHNSPNLETHYRYADERAAQDLDSDHAYRYLPHLSNLDYITNIDYNNQKNTSNQTNNEHRLKSLILRIATAPSRPAENIARLFAQWLPKRLSLSYDIKIDNVDIRLAGFKIGKIELQHNMLIFSLQKSLQKSQHYLHVRFIETSARIPQLNLLLAIVDSSFHTHIYRGIVKSLFTQFNRYLVQFHIDTGEEKPLPLIRRL